MTEQLGEYELVRHLATGGMAEIFVARQLGSSGLDRELAIKRILPHLAREERFISMFLDEARIAARLQHPNIVQIYELGEESGEYFIAMEYIEGGDLADILDMTEERNVEVPIAMSIRIIADVLSALDYAHEFSEEGKPLRIVHRDVSPHNVLIGKDGMIKLVDFGIAHAVERHAKTETGLVKGKLSYMAPEQVEQHGVDRRADIFSAGALLFELLTGHPPFGRELAAVNAILNEDPPNPQSLRPDVPDELVEVLFRSLEKNPDDRYQSANEMLEALEDVLRVFDKEVTPKHVARFVEALLSGAPIEGFEDVSQSIPRAVGKEAMVRAAYAVGTPVPVNGGIDDTVVDPPLGIVADDEAPTTPLGGAISEVMSVRSNEFTYSGQSERRLPTKLFGAAAAVLLAVGAGVAVLANSSAQPQEPVRPAIDDTHTAEEPLAVIELDDQYVEVADEPDTGFTFDEEELELAELEEWVAALDADQIDHMLAMNYEREDGDYLFTVRGGQLARDVLGPREPVNPGDPRAPKLLGLEDLDESVLKPKPRKKKGKKRRSTVKRSTPKNAQAKVTVEAKPDLVQADPEPAEVKVEEKPKPKPKPKPAPKKKRPKKNDLQIIDKAVPY